MLKERKTGEMVWEFRYYAADAKGVRRRRSELVGTLAKFPSESAIRKSPEVQSLVLRINVDTASVAADPPTFGSLLARYEKEELPERYSTAASYRSQIKNYIRPRWADYPLTGMKAMAIEDWLKSLALAPKTKSHIRTLMHTIFECAIRWELTEKNPLKLVRVKGGTKRRKTARTLTPEEFCLIPPLLPEPYRTQVWIAGCLGLRPSEIMALRWPDFDFDDLSLLVQRGVVHGRVDDVKTEYSEDRVPLDPALAAIILRHRTVCEATEDEWVFPSPVTHRPFHQDSIQQHHLRGAGVKAGLGDGLGWRSFRHSYRAWMDDTGAPMSVQKELMRHASIQTTMNVYGKALSDTKRQAHSKVVQMVLKDAHRYVSTIQGRPRKVKKS